MKYKTKIRFIALGLSMMAVFSGCAATSSSKENKISIDGKERHFLLYRPSHLSTQSPVPLVVVLHGGFGTAEQAEKFYGWDKEADAHGFVVVYPNGYQRSWNAGGICCGKAMKENINDLQFVTEVIERVSRTENIDRRRIYLTGISNGAALAYRYACEGSYPIAAVGSVAGSLSTGCAHPRAVSVMEIHGPDDQNIPLAGGVGSKGVSKVDWLPVQQTINIFRNADQCATASLQQDGGVQAAVSLCPQGRKVALFTVNGAGHQWPGSKHYNTLAGMLLPLDQPSDALDATDVLWQFFSGQ
ncbi:MAG TPA: PHB depolymerase family esterase [Rickettsiales bacterium]|nr:PHB depolymerase family esterase [Rickettsiales bacterium]